MKHTRCEGYHTPGYEVNHLSFEEVREAIFLYAYGRKPRLDEVQRCTYWTDRHDLSGTLRFTNEKET